MIIPPLNAYVPDGADRRVDSGVEQVLSEPERRVLTARVGMMHQLVDSRAGPIVSGT